MADRHLPTLKIVVQREGETLAEHVFTEESITIGRDQAALLSVDHDDLAEMHAVLNVEDDGSVSLLDLGAGGIVLGDAPLESNATLEDGATFSIAGLSFTMHVTDASDAPVAAAPTEANAEAESEADVDTTTPSIDVRPQTNGEDQASSDSDSDLAASASASASAAPSFEGESLEDVLAFVLKSGTGKGNQGLDTKRPKVLEVNEIWNNVLLETKHVEAGRDVTVGDTVGYRWSLLGIPIGWVPESMVGPLSVSPPIWSEVLSLPRQDFFASDDNLPGDLRSHDLFLPDGKTWKANLHESWTGFIERDGERTPLDQAVDKGLATRQGDHIHVKMDDDTRLLVEMGGLIFFAHLTFPGTKVVVPFGDRIDYPLLATSLFCALMGALSLVALITTEPPSRTDLDELNERFVELIVERPEPKDKKETKPEANPDAGEGAKAKKEEGKTGKKDAKMKEAKGDKREIDQAQRDREIAENAGLLGAMDDMGGSDGVFGGSLDASVTGGLGGLIGAKGTQVGAGGLGSRGSGLGGGGSAEGLGGLGTKGAGGGKSGYGKGGGSFGEKGSGGISAASGNPIIMGALDRALIDAVIKRKMNQIKYCYQRELQKDPSLGGKLVIQFTIAGNGSVSKASPKASMGSPAVDKCVVDRFYSMQFPEPKGGGIVIVSYPFIFSPG